MSKHDRDFHPGRAPTRAVMSFNEHELRALHQAAKLLMVFSLGEVKTLPTSEDETRLEAALMYADAQRLRERFDVLVAKL